MDLRKMKNEDKLELCRKYYLGELLCQLISQVGPLLLCRYVKKRWQPKTCEKISNFLTPYLPCPHPTVRVPFLFSVPSASPALPVADPEFTRGGVANPQRGGANLLFGQKFPRNCMKMKKFGPRGGDARPWRPLPP